MVLTYLRVVAKLERARSLAFDQEALEVETTPPKLVIENEVAVVRAYELGGAVEV
jgi:hypothetical protein